MRAVEWHPGGLVGLRHAGPVEEAPARVAATAVGTELAAVHILVTAGARGRGALEIERLVTGPAGGARVSVP